MCMYVPFNQHRAIYRFLWTQWHRATWFSGLWLASAQWHHQCWEISVFWLVDRLYGRSALTAVIEQGAMALRFVFYKNVTILSIKYTKNQVINAEHTSGLPSNILFPLVRLVLNDLMSALSADLGPLDTSMTAVNKPFSAIPCGTF